MPRTWGEVVIVGACAVALAAFIVMLMFAAAGGAAAFWTGAQKIQTIIAALIAAAAAGIAYAGIGLRIAFERQEARRQEDLRAKARIILLLSMSGSAMALLGRFRATLQKKQQDGENTIQLSELLAIPRPQIKDFRKMVSDDCFLPGEIVAAVGTLTFNIDVLTATESFHKEQRAWRQAREASIPRPANPPPLLAATTPTTPNPLYEVAIADVVKIVADSEAAAKGLMEVLNTPGVTARIVNTI